MPSSRAAELGAPLLRREDERLLRGEGRFVADVPCPGALHAAFVRSGYAHAVVNGLEGLAEARAAPGVVAVLTAADVAGLGALPVKRPLIGVTLDIPDDQPYLAGDRVRFVGEPVALVVATDAYAAADAAARDLPRRRAAAGGDVGRGRGRRRPIAVRRAWHQRRA